MSSVTVCLETEWVYLCSVAWSSHKAWCQPNTLIKEWKGDQSFTRIHDAVFSLADIVKEARDLAPTPTAALCCLINRVNPTVRSSPLSHSRKGKSKLARQEKSNLPSLLCQSLKGCWKDSVRKGTMQWKETANWERLSVLPTSVATSLAPLGLANQAHEELLSSSSGGCSPTQEAAPIWLFGSFTHFNFLSF